MSQTTTGSLLFRAFKAVLSSVLQLCAICIAFILRTVGIVLTKIGETVDKIIIKHSS